MIDSTSVVYSSDPGGGGLLDLNFYGDVPTKIFFHPAAEFLPSNDSRF